MRLRPIATALGGLICVILAFGEATHWCASRRRLGNGESPGRTEAIVVLGYKNAGTRANFMNRYRVRAGLRSIDSAAEASTLVFCGGAVAGRTPEAELMENYAREVLRYTGPIRLDVTSRSTWENIQNAIPLIEDAESIKVVSNSLHAEKGRAYLWKQRPDLAERLARGSEYRVGEITLIKPLAAVIGLHNLFALHAR
ncbi:YdcF family protein [Leifsonia sp. ZF2019]|uniref:YdcF family protein n=1 Tax=Leifsonia sp. ZF2019 TaxID=2781978 RepID=UPI001CBEC7F4|nr:YdcF family protein [Leifsonia sp. ZF2019]UAJ77813.1 YdcF family protein [Leifsonia sp. ZF2019]